MTKPKTNHKEKQENLPLRKIIALTIATAALAAFTTVHAQTETAPAPPNDAQIAQIVVTADSVDVDYGNLAVKKTKNAQVKAFAETMIRTTPQ
jgi:putative membrane protein